MSDDILVLPSGLSCGLLPTGLAVSRDCLGPQLDAAVLRIGREEHKGCLKIAPQAFQHIAGFSARVLGRQG